MIFDLLQFSAISCNWRVKIGLIRKSEKLLTVKSQ